MDTTSGNDQQPQNIKDQKKAEEFLRQIQLIVDNSHDAIIGETLDGTITTWNGGAAKMFGYSPQEIIGKSILTLFPLEMKDELPKLLSKIKMGQVIADYDSVRLQKDGSKIDVAISLSPVKMEDGTVIGVSRVERDITQRKKEEEQLRQIQLIVDNSHDAIIGETLDGTITSWNDGATKMFGYLPGEMIGKLMSDLSPLEFKNESPGLIEKVKRDEVVADYDSIWIRKNGVLADVEFSISPVHSEGGVIMGASLVGRDITERKKNEKRIKELSDVRSKFIDIISHQLRTPIGALNWNLEVILNGDFGKLEETQYKFLQATHKSSVEITRRIRDLLTAVDIEEDRVTFNKEEMALDNITTAIISEIKERCKIKNISCIYIPPKKEFPIIEGDSEKIRTAIIKLMENALIYTKENGEIIAKLEKIGNILRFEVSDNGIGIPEPEQHRVFTRFFRASNASIMQPDAFGLGLFVAKNFIERRGGKIGFKSTEGKGSTFWFEIPLKKEFAIDM